jgi:hypothetical protein
LQLVALHVGSLSVVQPLLISGLLFALILRPRLERRRITRRELRWALLLTAALTGFVLVVGTGHGGVHESVDRLPAAMAGLIGAFATLACIALARRAQGSGQSAAVLGVAVGFIYAGTAALLKAVTDVAVGDPVRLLSSWQLYAVVVLGVGGLLLNQLAFQAGPITASLPAIATIDPLASIVIGVIVFDEHLRRGPADGALLVMLLIVLVAAVVQLARSSDGPGSARDRVLA